MLHRRRRLDDPVIFCEHKYPLPPAQGRSHCRRAPARSARPASSARQTRRHRRGLQRDGPRSACARRTELPPDGWEIEVVDLRSVKPLDTDTVLASVARTGRLLAVGEALPWGGVTAEVVARVAERGLWPARRPAAAAQRQGHTRSLIIRTCGPPTARPRAASPPPPAPCYAIESHCLPALLTPKTIKPWKLIPPTKSQHFKFQTSNFQLLPMPPIPIIMPQLGESIAEATVVSLAGSGRRQVETGQDIIEVETSKATMNVAVALPGQVERFLVKLRRSYPVGAVLGYLEARRRTPRGWAGRHAAAARRRKAKNPSSAAGRAIQARSKPASSRPCAGCPSRRMPPAPATCPRA